MTFPVVDESQRTAARVVGFTYFFGNVTAMFTEFYVNARLIAYDNATETARNIVAHERLFRIGIASNLITFAADVLLITALYVVLKSINQNLALAAAFWGLVETAILVTTTLHDLDVLRVLSAADYLRVFEPARLHALARFWIDAHGASYNIGLVFFGIRSILFCYLWFKSDYIPRALAAWGVFSSFVIGAAAFTFVIFPNLRHILAPSCYVPIIIFELAMGLWLPVKGLRPARRDAGPV